MEVRIKRPDGTSFNSYLLPTDTVEHLRELITLRFQLEKRESENLKILRTSSLANGSMEENGIQNGSTIIVDFPGAESGKCSDPFHDAIYSVDPRKLTDRATIPVDKGGVGLLNDGSAFHVEKGATDKVKELTMSIAPPAAAKTYKDHDDIDGGQIKQLYSLEPHGATFTKPVWVALPYDPKIPVERLGVFYIQANPDGTPLGTWKYIPISRFDGAKAIVSVTHFSGIGVFEFADVAKQRTATLMRTDNKWEAVNPGLIYRGTCKNPTCPVTGKVVNCARGFGTFNLATDLIDNALCPVCNQGFDPDKFVLYDTEAVVKWMKEDKTKGDDPYSVSNSEVRAFGIDSYGTTGSAKYRSFVIQTKPGKSTSFFIDVCFGLDCTGSMGPYIAAGQAQIIKIAQGLETELKAKSLNSKLRVSFVGYRDYNADGSRPADILDIVPFTNDISTLVARVSAQKATGGADTPEHIVGALKSATDLEWQGSTRVFVLIGDAPCHGREYHDKDETFPAGDPSGLTPPPFLELLITKNIHFFFMRINNSTDKMIDKFRANYDNSVNNSKEMKIEVMDLGSDPNIMGKLVLDGVMKKINDLFI